MSFKLLKLDPDTVYEYVFERYTALNSNADDIRQDLGIENSKNKNLIVEIAGDFNKEGKTTGAKSGKRKKGKPTSQTDTFYTFEVNQQLTSLHSNVDNGNSTTGYVLWSLTPFFVKWLLFNNNSLPMREPTSVEVITADGDNLESMKIPTLLNETTNVLELGCGISSILPLICCNHVRKYICTDQRGILGGLKANLITNLGQVNRREIVSSTLNIDKEVREEEEERKKDETVLEVLPLDWELFPKTSDKSMDPNIKSMTDPIYIVAMDVIYNEYLIDPFLDTLSTLLHHFKHNASALVGFHLRSDDIVQQFLEKTLDRDLQVYVIQDKSWTNSRYDLYYIKLI